MTLRLFVVCLLGLTSTATSAALPSWAPQKRGEVAFCYSGRYTPRQMKWFTRFGVVVSGYFLPPEQVRELRAAGSKLVWYEWSCAFYISKNTAADAWERKVLAEHPDWFLNTQPLCGGAGASDIAAYYWDIANPQMRQWWIDRLVRLAKEHDYEGVFFDTTTFNSVHPDAQAEFARRHPGESYDALQGQLFRELRQAAPELIIFPNQGYRSHRYLLPEADFDISESYMTTGAGPDAEVYVEGKGLTKITETLVHTWYDPAHKWSSIAYYCDRLINIPYRENGYRARFSHLNYGQPRYEPTGRTVMVEGRVCEVYRPTLDREAMYYGIACSRLMGQWGLFSFEDKMPEDDIYFIDLGRPLCANYTYDRTRAIIWRLYENGIVIVNDSGRAVSVSFMQGQIPADVTGLWDTYTRKPIRGFAQTLSVPVPTSYYKATNHSAGCGRIYLYMRNNKQN